MDRLCTPWRYAYVSGQKKEEGCVFCNRLAGDDAEHFVLLRARLWYVILNLYPYNNGHLLLVLNRHLPTIGDIDAAELMEMGRLLAVMERTLRRAYAPDGINCGYNAGASAGAGVPEHFHVHLLPRIRTASVYVQHLAKRTGQGRACGALGPARLVRCSCAFLGVAGCHSDRESDGKGLRPPKAGLGRRRQSGCLRNPAA